MRARWIPAAGTAAVFTAIVLGGLSLLGVPPGAAAVEVLRGALGDGLAIAQTVRTFVPLALCGLGIALAFRCGLWNIGAEGQFVIGSLAGFAAASVTGSWVLALAAGSVGGAAWAAVAALLRQHRGVPEVLTTIMLNFVAIECAVYLVTGPWQEPTGQFPETALVAGSAQLPSFSIGDGRWHLGVLLVAMAAATLAWALQGTRAGVLVRATGDSERAVRAGGFSTTWIVIGTFAVSGSLAGLAGAAELCAVTHRITFSVDQGVGYTAIAVALLAGLRPAWVPLSAAVFAVLHTGTSSLQWTRAIEGLDRYAQVVQGLAIFAVLWFLTRRPEPSHG